MALQLEIRTRVDRLYPYSYGPSMDSELRPDPSGEPPTDPAPTLGLWPEPSGPWRLRFDWKVIDGRLECTGIELRSVIPDWDVEQQAAIGWRPNPQPLSTSVLRSLPLSSLIDEERMKVARLYRLWERLDPDFSREVSRRAELAIASVRGKGRLGRKPTRDTKHFSDVARVYSDVHAEGGHPTKAVKEKWGVSYPTAAAWVRRARKLGLLPATERGIARGLEGST